MPSYTYWLLLIASSVAAALLAHTAAVRKFPKRAPAPAANDEQSGAQRYLRVGTPYLLVDSRIGWALANPLDFYLGRAIVEYGEYGEDESRLLDMLIAFRPGTVVEVGANAGFLTVPMAKTLAKNGHHIVAFEPQPFVFQNLCANLALNGLTNVRAWPYACGDMDTTLYFQAPPYTTEGNFGSIGMEKQSTPASVEVRCVRLDDMIGTNAVSLMKIDVEGAELEVLIGASKLIDSSRPIIYVENDRPDKSPALIEWLKGKNYRLWWHGGALFNAENFFHNPKNLYENVASINMLCLPVELDMPTIVAEEVTDAHKHPHKREVPESA